MRIRSLGFVVLGTLAVTSCDTSQQLGPEPTLEEEVALAAHLAAESGESEASHRDGAEPLVVRLIRGILASENEVRGHFGTQGGRRWPALALAWSTRDEEDQATADPTATPPRARLWARAGRTRALILRAAPFPA